MYVVEPDVEYACAAWVTVIATIFMEGNERLRVYSSFGDYASAFDF